MIRATTWMTAVFLVGCAVDPQDDDSGDPGNQTGQEAAEVCDLGTETVIGLDEVTPSGFTTADFFTDLGEVQRTLTWEDGGSTGVTIRMELDTEQGVDTVWLVPFDDCDPYTRVPIWLDVVTDDGALDERMRTQVAVFDVDRATANGDTYGEYLGGDIDLERFGPVANLADTIVYFQAAVTESAWGTVRMRAQDEVNGSDLVDVASWQ